MADRLGMTVRQLRREMPNDEFIMWDMYHADRIQSERIHGKGV